MTFCPICAAPGFDAWMCANCADKIIEALRMVAPSNLPQPATPWRPVGAAQRRRVTTKSTSKGYGTQTLPWEAQNASPLCSVSGCNRSKHARGWCRTHYRRAGRHNGDPLAGNAAPGEATAYFDAHVDDETDECLIWPYAKNADGYGVLQSKRVHVLACERHHGPKPDGKEAAHGPCHNRACFNGRHLSWKTSAENAADMLRDGTLIQGEDKPNAKLSDDDVVGIRIQHEEGDTVSKIAREYGVDRSAIRQIIQGKTWKQVKPAGKQQVLPWESLAQSWAGFEDELLITLARLDRHGVNLGGGHSSDTPLPFSEAASDASHELRRALASWVIALCDPNHYPQDTLTGLAGWLIDNIDLIRCCQYAQQAFDELTSTVEHVLAAIGPHTGREAHSVDVTLLQSAPNAEATKQEILTALPAVTDARFRKWVSRGKIYPTAIRGNKPLYRVGDVLALIEGKAVA